MSLLSGFALPAVLTAAPSAAAITPGAPAGPAWTFEGSDLPVDPAFRFGRLANGLRYVIRHNETPRGTAVVRLEMAVGSLDEADDERGYAHFTEHMAFNGSTRLAEGEMMRLLERHGLVFGADANASTSFKTTSYMLDLPRTDPALVDLSLMLLREIGSELTFAPATVDRTLRVVLAEMRERNTWQQQNRWDRSRFLHPGARFHRRFPIGAESSLNVATAARLKAFWRREYGPEKATLIVVGDFEPDAVEAMIVARFAGWQAGSDSAQPEAGPIVSADGGRTALHIHKALSERVVASRHGPWIKGADTVAERRETALRGIGYAIVNRRLKRITRLPDPPFRDARFGTGAVHGSGRTTNLSVGTIDGRWRKGLLAAAEEYRRALAFGFGEAEVAEQVASIEGSIENAAASAETRSHRDLVQAALNLLRDGTVPTDPRTVQERFRIFKPQITAQTVLAALQREAVPLVDPLLRFEGRRPPKGGEAAIRAAWGEAMRIPLKPGKAVDTPVFGYTDFGPPGRIISDVREPALGIRRLRFANGVMLNIKPTQLDRGRVSVKVSLDGGKMLNTRDNPLAVEMVGKLPAGGLGKHPRDELQSILAGHTINSAITTRPETFELNARTTQRDLALQLRIFAAMIADPGYRQASEVLYRLNVNHDFSERSATPVAALSSALGGILSDGDPRFTLQPLEDHRALTIAKLKHDIADRFNKGAIEIGIVGDVTEADAIALAAATFGALPPREPGFRPYLAQRSRTFTGDLRRRVVRHDGAADQALLHLSWPTRDAADPVTSLSLKLLERVVLIELTQTLRGDLGAAYTPKAASLPSRIWPGYGTFSITVATGTGKVTATRAAIDAALSRLGREAVSADVFQRALQPLLESFDNKLKSNRGWLSLVGRAQGHPDEIDNHLEAMERLRGLRPEDIKALAARYLDPAQAREVLVLPKAAIGPAISDEARARRMGLPCNPLASPTLPPAIRKSMS